MENEINKNIESNVLIKIPVLKWGNFIKGWKKIMLILDEYYIHIMTLKSTFKKTNKITSITLQDVNIIDDNKKKQFQIITNNQKITIKTENEKDKFLFMDKANLAKKNLIMHRASTISSVIDNDDLSEKVIIKIEKLKSFLNKLDEINENILQIQMLEGEIKNKTREKFRSFITNIIFIGENLKKKIDKIISNNQNYIIQNKNNLNLINQIKPEQKNIKENNESISSSDEIEENYDMERLEEIKSIKEILNSSNMKITTFKKGLSTTITDFSDSKYNFSRNSLPINLQCPETMVKDFVKTFTTKNTSLPILYNEPISMLQKQCEKFYYSNLLKEASNEKINKELKICYLIGFICGELSLNINRYLKPFNPILGETFEFFDNERQFRYFSEQVSHNPVITAYMCESKDFVYFGDTRMKSSFKVFKGALEILFTNKTHILFKNTQDKFVFNKPKVYLSGIINGIPKYDYEGEVVIEYVNNNKIRGVVNFYEGKNKKNNEVSVDGIIYNDSKIIYRIKGNWNERIYYFCEGKENEEIDIWKINKDELYLNNTFKNYNLPSYSLNLNYINDDLKNILPKSDSRLRPDQREYELGNIDEAIKLRQIIEDNQRSRHKQFEEKKIVYEPFYFNNIFNDNSNDFVYVYKGGYFEDRSENKYRNEKEDIFDINEKNQKEDI
jgi:hypothetical protein